MTMKNRLLLLLLTLLPMVASADKSGGNTKGLNIVHMSDGTTKKVVIK